MNDTAIEAPRPPPAHIKTADDLLKDFVRRWSANLPTHIRPGRGPGADAEREELARCLGRAVAAMKRADGESFAKRMKTDHILRREAEIEDDTLLARFACAYVWRDAVEDWKAGGMVGGPEWYPMPISFEEKLGRAIISPSVRRHAETMKTERGWQIKKLTLCAGEGFQLAFAEPAMIKIGIGEIDRDGKIGDNALAKAAAAILGPQRWMLVHAGFALARIHAYDEGRRPDGRFWFSKTGIADLLGYKREGNGLASSSRIGRDATRQIGRYWKDVINLRIQFTYETAAGRRIEVIGGIFEPTSNVIDGRPGKLGRDRRVEWRVNARLWEVLEQPREDDAWEWKDYVRWELEELDKRDERGPEWAAAFRVLEVLKRRVRFNRQQRPDGLVPIGLGYLTEESGVVRGFTRPQKTILDHVQRLERRGYITYAPARLSRGEDGLLFKLRDRVMAGLGHRFAPRSDP